MIHLSQGLDSEYFGRPGIIHCFRFSSIRREKEEKREQRWRNAIHLALSLIFLLTIYRIVAVKKIEKSDENGSLYISKTDRFSSALS